MGTQKYPNENDYSDVIFILLSSSPRILVNLTHIHLNNKPIIISKSQAMLLRKHWIDSPSFLLVLLCLIRHQKDN